MTIFTTPSTKKKKVKCVSLIESIVKKKKVHNFTYHWPYDKSTGFILLSTGVSNAMALLQLFTGTMVVLFDSINDILCFSCLRGLML